MGREVKRVDYWFEWPLKEVYSGYLNPFYDRCLSCLECGGSGLNRESKRIADDWYDFAERGLRWCYDITQDEVDALVEAGRLLDFTHEFDRDQGWVPKKPRYKPSAAEVNSWAPRAGMMGHDAINRMICVKTRCKRLGVWGACSTCGGDGEVWSSGRAKQQAEAWVPCDPPPGPGWQLWETVSQGSPVTPVFSTPIGLAAWLSQNESRPRMSFLDWLEFVRGPAWAPSLLSRDGSVMYGVEGVKCE